MRRLSALSLLVALNAASLWTDVTVHHETGRGLRELQSLPEDALVQRVPSETVFVYNLNNALDVALIDTLEQIELPLCIGGIATFTLKDSGLLPKELQKEVPSVRSFHGWSSEGYSADIVFTPVGIRAQIWTPSTRCYVDPHTKGRPELHTVHAHHDQEPGRRPSSPGLLQQLDAMERMPRAAMHAGRRLDDATPKVQAALPPAGFAETYTYRIVVTCSYEYIQYAQAFGGGMALLTTTLTRVNGIWGREVGTQFTLHPNNTVVCGEDATTKVPSIQLGELPNNNPSAWMAPGGWPGMKVPKQNLAWLTDKGFDINSYDIAHFFSVGDAGGLGGQTVCDPTSKGNGGTAGLKPSGDSFDVEYVAHEMGHQFGTSHTWAGSKGSCTQDQFMSASAVELGSGSTLETYANICDTDNIATASQPYFHVFSMAEFQTWYQVGNGPFNGKATGCGTFSMSTTNHRPTVSAPATCLVPKATPFILSGSGTDDDGDTLSFNWEQLDASPTRWSVDAENKQGPLFISVTPSTTGNVRSFPKLQTVMDNAGTTNIDRLERLSTEARVLHMALTARDKYNSTAGAATIFGTFHAAFTSVNVAAYGPLTITEPKLATTTGVMKVSWEISGPTGQANSDPANTAVMGSTFEVAYSICTGTGTVPSQAGCGAAWITPPELQNLKVTAQGRGTASFYLPDTVVGNVIFRVKGSPSFGCEFYTVTPMIAVTAGIVAMPSLFDTQPSKDATGVPLALAKVTIAFSGMVYLNPEGALFTVTPAGGSSKSYDKSQVVQRGINLDLSLAAITPLSSSIAVTVHVNDGALCASPVWPCTSPVTFADWSFTTGTSRRLSTPYTPRRLDATVPFDNPIWTYPLGTDAIINGGELHVVDPSDTSGDIYCIMDVTDEDYINLNISSNSLVVDFTDCALWPGTTYNVSIEAGALWRLDESEIPAIKLRVTTTKDLVPPKLDSSSPVNASTGVPEYDDIALSFSKYIDVADRSASILLKSLTDGSPDVTIPLSDCCGEDNQVLIYFDDGAVIITPNPQLASRTTYSVIIPPGAFFDFSGNNFTGLSLGQYVFTTGDTIPPNVDGINYTVVGAGVSAQVCYDAGAQLTAGRGNFVLVDPSTNATVASVGVKDSSVSIDGNCISVDFSDQQLPVPQASSAAESRLLAAAPKVALQFSGGAVVDDMGNGVMPIKAKTTVTVQASFPMTVISGSFAMSVTNPASFVNNPSNVILVSKGISQAIGIPASWINVTLSAVRRLGEIVSRKLASAVKVVYAISVPDNAPPVQNAAAVKTFLVQAILDPTILSTKLSNATGVPVTCASIVAVGGPNVTATTATSTTTTAKAGTGLTTTASTTAAGTGTTTKSLPQATAGSRQQQTISVATFVAYLMVGFA